MRTIRQIREDYNQNRSASDKLEQLVMDGLLDEGKLTLVRRALRENHKTLTNAEKNALLETINVVLSDIDISEFDDVELLDEAAKDDYLSKFDPRFKTRFPTDKEAPQILILKRKAIRVFPDNAKVALYYAQGIDKYISIPFGEIGVGSVNEAVKVGQVVKHDDGDDYEWKGAQWVNKRTGKIAKRDVGQALKAKHFPAKPKQAPVKAKPEQAAMNTVGRDTIKGVKEVRRRLKSVDWATRTGATIGAAGGLAVRNLAGAVAKDTIGGAKLMGKGAYAAYKRIRGMRKEEREHIENAFTEKLQHLREFQGDTKKFQNQIDYVEGGNDKSGSRQKGPKGRGTKYQKKIRTTAAERKARVSNAQARKERLAQAEKDRLARQTKTKNGILKRLKGLGRAAGGPLGVFVGSMIDNIKPAGEGSERLSQKQIDKILSTDAANRADADRLKDMPKAKPQKPGKIVTTPYPENYPVETRPERKKQPTVKPTPVTPEYPTDVPDAPQRRKKAEPAPAPDTSTDIATDVDAGVATKTATDTKTKEALKAAEAKRQQRDRERTRERKERKEKRDKKKKRSLLPLALAALGGGVDDKKVSPLDPSLKANIETPGAKSSYERQLDILNRKAQQQFAAGQTMEESKKKDDEEESISLSPSLKANIGNPSVRSAYERLLDIYNRKAQQQFASGQTMQEQLNTIEEAVEFTFEDGSVTVTPSMAKTMLNVYNKVNEENKKKIEHMMYESADSLKKFINFASRY